MIWRVETENAHALLARLAGEVWGLDPLPEPARLPGGKPWFPGRPERCFSLSHSGPLSLCVLSDRPVGGDVERLRPRREGLPRYVFSDGELEWFRTRGARWEDFYTLWTMKEARVKCTGEGLRRPAREIAVPLLDPGGTAEREGFRFTALAGEGWRGAVCEALE